MTQLTTRSPMGATAGRTGTGSGERLRDLVLRDPRERHAASAPRRFQSTAALDPSDHGRPDPVPSPPAPEPRDPAWRDRHEQRARADEAERVDAEVTTESIRGREDGNAIEVDAQAAFR